MDMNIRYLPPLEYNELNAIEWDYIRHDIGENYLHASWSFSDLEAADIKLEKQDRDFYDQIVFDLEEERYIKQYEGFRYMLPAIEQESVGAVYLNLSYMDIRNKNEADLTKRNVSILADAYTLS